MAEMKGKVIRIDQKSMVVLTDEGDFLKKPIPAVRPNPGDIVDVFAEPVKHFSFPIWARAVVAVLVLGLSLVLARPFVLPQAVAAVSMDLASSVELSINRGNTVLKVKANNEQGEVVLRDLEIIGMDIYEAANLITAKAVELGYLQTADESTIMVTVAPLTSVGTLTVNREKLQQGMHDELLKQNYEGYLVVNQGPIEIVQEAAEMGMTVNQYTVWKQVQAQPDQIDIQAFRGEPVGKIIANDETNLNRMFPGMWCRVRRMGIMPNVPSPAPESGAAAADSAGGSSALPGADQSGGGPTGEAPNGSELAPGTILDSSQVSPNPYMMQDARMEMRGLMYDARFGASAGLRGPGGQWMGNAQPGAE